MIKFLLKGILRDKNRSLLPIMVISIGVFLTVFMSAWMKGIFEDIVDLNANFTTGHVKIETRAYAENESQMPNDLALLNIDSLMKSASKDFPELEFVPRIQFGCLLDIPDSTGETRAQGPGIGKAIDILSPGTKEIERMNLKKSLVKGEIPDKRGEALVSDDFVEQFGLNIGEKVTIFGSTMDGSMMFRTFRIAGTVRFGVGFIDRGAIIIDIRDGQEAMDMDDASSEILGFF
ncbi:MAG TPA: hypothetical protein ENK91_01865, partial [Bacteroidetes bacterium]|nr:hypothetical protein [Bacteroidota bacterium]